MTTPSHSLRLVPQAGEQTLSKNQRAFNTLLSKLDKARERLAQWETFLPDFQSQCQHSLIAHTRALNAARKRLLQTLDAACAAPDFNATDRRRASDYIRDVATDMLSFENDPEVRALLQRHTPQVRVLPRDALPMDDLFGFDPDAPQADAAPHGSDAEAKAEAEAEAAFRAFQQAAAEAARQELDRPARAPRLHTAPEQALRALYRQLASALHPDREPDAASKAHKTALLQRANKAYAAQDLHALLSLQLEAALISRAQLAVLAEAQFKEYAAALRQQLRETEDRIREIEHDLADANPMPRRGKMTPQRLRADFALALEDFDLERANIDDLLQRAQNHKVLKAWLRQEEKIAQQQFIEDDLQAAMQEAMESLMREFRPPAPKPKRRKRA
ncbi:MAG: J domain-containing protein [Burkholderiaceae bacterium]|nr:J domain-containing protein [Burkholderiaceae bacterium]